MKKKGVSPLSIELVFLHANKNKSLNPKMNFSLDFMIICHIFVLINVKSLVTRLTLLSIFMKYRINCTLEVLNSY